MKTTLHQEPGSPVICQEGVKKQFDSVLVSVRPDDLKSLRLELSESLSEFGLTLKRAINPRAEYGFTRQYISRLEHGQDAITDEIKTAFFRIAAIYDGVPESVASYAMVKMLVQPNVPEGTLIPASAKVIKCARPGCPVMFVKIHPRQIYHDPICSPWRGRK